MNNWDIALGGGLCLEQKVEELEVLPPDARQRIHFTYGTPTSVTHEYEPTTGTLKTVQVVSSASYSPELAFLLGQALGLGRSENAKNSVMSYPNTERSNPGTDDQTSLRALYGPPQAWCR